ncbi:putative pentatricopeptide repeat-containing protein [Zea mays]|uniref:Putative pentatricopeptide repeat-containing protein n=2 Tax=Zea mays TaxID=4577 RepID=K7TTG1_MAIZE|nr:putative pentatricopeptide repeat-containing protein At5g08490 [Zea mays]AQK43808.1 Putative pentatricopeptide repeat-containing protein [Zea mays]PWZ44742.1 putative pentatricopeptide repeat-containing protein [Zea mays]|eukprot:XP_020401574.1 putative pentatricopeptide repeat-containing protein At5g08490 [Zea mays]
MGARYRSLGRTSYSAASASSRKARRAFHGAAPATGHMQSQCGSAPLGLAAPAAQHIGCMLGEGHRPGALELAAAIRSSSALPGSGSALARCLHGLAVKAGRVASSATVAKAVMDAYGRFGSLADALLLFDEMARPDAVCWNILITACSRRGLFEDAFILFRSMLSCGVGQGMPTAVTVAVIVPACAKWRHLQTGRSVHCYVVKTGLESDTLCGNALVSMYAKCGGSRVMVDAHRAFSSIRCKDVVSWNSVIAGYIENQLFGEALALFSQMISQGYLPNYSTVASILPVCSFTEFGRHHGKEVHSFVVRHGMEIDVSVSNALMTHYSKVLEMKDVESIFTSMDVRDIVSWNTIIAGYVMNGYHHRALGLFQGLLSTGIAPDSVSFISLLTACAQVGDVKTGMEVHGYIFQRPVLQETSLMNALVTFYSHCDRFDDAFRAFTDILNKDSISWNAILSACATSEQHIEKFFVLMSEMCRGVNQCQWDSVTVLNVIHMSTFCGIKMVREAHGWSLRVGYTGETSVANAILDAYVKCGYSHDASILFRNHAGRNIVTDNIMISCYLKSNCIEDAEVIFNHMAEKDLTSWNLMIQLYAQNDMDGQAFSLFNHLQSEGLKPDIVSIANILEACIHLCSVQLVRQCHAYMLRASLEDIHLEGALVDAYSKCGNITNAYNIFQISPKKDLVTFTAMIGCYAMHGMAEEAVELFSKMLKLDIRPDHVVLTTLLSACSHAGLVDAGIKIFKSIREIHRVVPTAEHYACMVDLLARSGHIQDAYMFALDMPPHAVNANAWSSLLGACKVHGKVEIGQLAAGRLFSMEGGDIGNYVIMSNIYAADEKWDGVENVRKLMKSIDMKKPAGCSWIEVEKTRHLFIASDINHQDRSCIYDMLGSLYQQIKDTHTQNMTMVKSM